MSGKRNEQALGSNAVPAQQPVVSVELETSTETPTPTADTSTALITTRRTAEERIQLVEEFKVLSEKYREAKGKKEELSIFAAGLEGKFVTLSITYDDKEFQIRSSKMIAEVCALISARIEHYVELCRREVETFNI